MKIRPIVLCNIDKQFINDINLDVFSKLFELILVPKIIDWKASLEEVSRVEILWVGLEENIHSEIMEKFPALRVVATSTTGLTHIDLQCLRKKSLDLVSIKDEKILLEKISSTAELAWGLMLVLLRHIVVADRAAHFTRDFRMQYFSKQISSLELGIVGFGRVGRQLAKFADSFGAKWFFYDVLPNGIEKELAFKELNSLIKDSDVLFICASIKAEFQYPILDATKVKKLKQGSIIINVGRGALVDEYAILESLTQREISGYATDVLRLEEIHQESAVPLARITQLIEEGFNLVVTPHIGGATSDALELVNSNIMNQLIRIYAGSNNENIT